MSAGCLRCSWVTPVIRTRGLKPGHSRVWPHSLLTFVMGDLKNYQQNTFVGLQRARCHPSLWRGRVPCTSSVGSHPPAGQGEGATSFLPQRRLQVRAGWLALPFHSALGHHDVPSRFDTLHPAIRPKVPFTLSSRAARNECK